MKESRRQTQRKLLVVSAVLLCAAGCESTCGAQATSDDITPTVADVTSGSVRLSWPGVRGATEVRVIVGSGPPSNDEGTFRSGRRVARLDGDEDEYTIDHLPPGIDLWVRLEADTPRGVKSAVLHARTPRGVRPEGTPAVSVAAVAPKVLMVTLRNGNGRVWGRRGWTVRKRNGDELRVTAVHRHSVPVAQRGYQIGFGEEDDLSQVDVDHRIYLELAEAIGSPEVLTIEGPNDARLLVPFHSCYLETPVIQLNQVGYSPRARVRYAYVSAWMGDGGALDLESFPNRATIFREVDDPMRPRRRVGGPVPIRRRSQNDGDAGTMVFEIDLSSVPASEDAVYRIEIEGVGVSYPTRISESAVFEAYYVTARGLFHNRWGGDLDARYTDFPRPQDHRWVYVKEQDNPFEMYPRDTRGSGRRIELRGGYHDAGDFDQRPMHTVVPQILLRTYESAPSRFVDGQLVLPESGNDLPDLLDEALWGVEGWAALQERDGGVRGGVESTRHPWGIYAANDDQLEYFTFARDPQVSMRVAGVFAQAAYDLRQLDSARSRALRQRAERAYRWASSRGPKDPYHLYAAGELYRLTNEASYKRAFEETWNRIGPYGAFSNFTDRHNFTGDYAREGQVMPDYILGYLLSPNPDPEILERSRRELSRRADEIVTRILESPHAHRNPRPEGRPVDWGQGTVMGRYLDLIFATMALGGSSDEDRQRYFDAISVAADYVLGANPLGMSFITGLGTVTPQEPLHLDSLVFVKQGRPPMPGIPIYGPVQGLPRAEYYRYAQVEFHPAFDQHPLMRRYADVRTFVVTNECTIWECQAPHTEHFAALIGDGQRPPDRLLPRSRR